MAKSVNTQKGLSWRLYMMIVVILIIFIFVVLRFIGNNNNSESDVNISHIHGLGFDASGKNLSIAIHDGLVNYSEGKWSRGKGERNDYMGYSPYSEGFFSSGHPAPGSDLPNPLGIVHSADEGQTVKPLAFTGEIDFHVMSAGYNSGVLYVNHPESSPSLGQGLFYSQDEGETWTKADAKGLSGEILSIAVHPDQPGVVAVGTAAGAYLSEDFGNTFNPNLVNGQITALSFHSSGKLLAASYQDEKVQIIEVTPKTQQIKEYDIPITAGDVVSYIAANPQNELSIAFATYQSQIYLSENGGGDWSRITE